MAIRTYGLSGSGMDVDQLVKDLMKARRTKYDSMYQKKTQAEWKKADYNAIYTSLKEFRNTTLFNYKMQGATAPKKVSGTNDTAVSATANADAANMTHQMDVDQIASGVQKASTTSISVSTDKSTIRSQFGLGAGATPFILTIGDGTNTKDLAVDPDASIYDLVSNINKLGLKVQANYDTTLDRFFISSTSQGSAAALDFTPSGIELGGNYADGINFLKNSLKLNIGTTTKTSTASIASGDALNTTLTDLFGLTGPTSFTVNVIDSAGIASPVTINVDNTKTLQQFIDDINTQFGQSVASYDANYGRFTLKAPTGAVSIEFDPVSPGIDFLKDNLKLNVNQYAENGRDAYFNLDGVYLSQGKNDFTISSVNYSLKTTTASAVSLSVSPDIDKTIESVKKFVEAYNTIIGTVTTELNEDRYKDYNPLTDEQKSEMKESEILAWEKKAKSGLLRRDSILQDVQRKMRSDVTTAISGLTGKYKTASSIGITTGSYVDKDGNVITDKNAREKIEINETNLRAALTEDPDIVYKLFTADGEDSSSDGIVRRLYDTLDTMLKRIEEVAGTTASTSGADQSMLGKQIRDYKNRMYDLNIKLKTEESLYYKKFDAMEVALQKLNSQSSWLTQQFSS